MSPSELLQFQSGVSPETRATVQGSPHRDDLEAATIVEMAVESRRAVLESLYAGEATIVFSDGGPIAHPRSLS